MTIADVVEKRRAAWAELESLCQSMEVSGKVPASVSASRFAALYRSACADLALSEAYQLAPGTVAYLHRLVARSHSQFYRSRGLQLAHWFHMLLEVAPKQIFNDNCVRFCFILFYAAFTGAMLMAFSEDFFPGFPEKVIGKEQMKVMEQMYEKPLAADFTHYFGAAGFYIWHNTSIGLQCFVLGFLIVPCIYVLGYNAVTLGTVFGFMARESVNEGENFLQFVTAHGPFELTAIVLSAAAGMRCGLGWIYTARYRRIDSLRRAAEQAVPVMTASVVLFALAALTEGFISPSPVPYFFKAMWSVFSSGLIMFYFVVLGFPRDRLDGV